MRLGLFDDATVVGERDRWPLLIVVPKAAPSDNADRDPAADVLPALRGFNGDSVDCACALIELLEFPLSLRVLLPAIRRRPADDPAAFGLLLADGPEK